MENQKNRMLLSQYKSIKEQAEEIQKEISNINEKRIEVGQKPYGNMAVGGRLNTMEIDCKLQIKAILKSYNDNRLEVEELLEVKIPIINYSNESPRALLSQLIIECNKVISYLEPLEAKGLSKKLDKPANYSKEIIKIPLKNKSLWAACKTSFENGEYWNACLHAFIHLETKIREKAELPAEEHGVGLVDAAFNPKHGVLKIPSCETISEEEGFHLINRGIVQFHRNAKGHREGSIEMNDAIKIIYYVDYILDVINTAQKRTTQLPETQSA